MRSTLTIGRPFGIPIGMHWSLVALGGFAVWILATANLPAVASGYPTGTYWITAAVIVVLYIASIVAHELGHAIVARRNGIAVDRITLWVLGGLAEMNRNPDRPGVELSVAAAGPGASALMTAVSFGLAWAARTYTDAGVLTAGLWWLFAANAFVTVFNLLPARPLDGGRIFTALVWRLTGDRRRATGIAAAVAVWIGAGLAAVGLLSLLAGGTIGIWFAVIGWMIVSSSRAERLRVTWSTRSLGVRAGQAMSPPPSSIPAWTSAGDLFGAGAAGRGNGFVLVHDGAGKTVGALDLRRLQHLAFQHPDTTAGDVAVPIDRLPVVGVDDDLGQLPPDLLPPVLVIDGERVVGVVTVADLHRVADRRAAPPPPPPPMAPTSVGRSPWPPPPAPSEPPSGS